MGCCRTLKEEFHLKNLKYDYDNPESFVRSRWQKKDGVSIPYLVYRWLMVVFFWATMGPCFAEVDDERQSLGRTLKWPIFITNWSYFLDSIQAIVAAILITRALVLERRGKGAECKMCWAVKMYWILQTTAVVLAIGVTLGYWGAVHNYANDKVYVTGLTVHGMNSVLMILDLFLASHPFRLLHVYCPLTVTILFLIWSLIYFVAGGKNKDDQDYIYPTLDWRKPVACSIFAIGGVIYVLILHVLVWLLYLLRQWLFVVCAKKNVPVNPVDTENEV